jgi:Spy/CpxP family protein refolding chaperone
MKKQILMIAFASLCFVTGAGNVQAQGRPPAGPPGGGPGGPGPGGPGGPGGPSNGAPSSTSRQSSSAQHSGLQLGPVGRWWDDRTVIHQVGISKDQQKKMDSIFDANKSSILASYKTFLSEQSKLDALNKNPSVDKSQLFAQIDAVNQARAALQKSTSQMLLQIRQEMNADQIDKLEKLK